MSSGGLVQLSWCADKKDSQKTVSCHSISCLLRYNCHVMFNKAANFCYDSCFGDSSLPDGFIANHCESEGERLIDCGGPTPFDGSPFSDGSRSDANVGVICGRYKFQHEQQCKIIPEYLQVEALKLPSLPVPFASSRPLPQPRLQLPLSAPPLPHPPLFLRRSATAATAAWSRCKISRSPPPQEASKPPPRPVRPHRQRTVQPLGRGLE